jgi:four helix bundle protein
MANRQDLHERAFRLAAYVFRLYPKLAAQGAGHAWVARQLLRSTSSIGSNLEEGAAATSRREMAAKYSISLRESREGKFWARLLAIDGQWTKEMAWVVQETGEFIAMLTVSVKKLRKPPSEPDKA